MKNIPDYNKRDREILLYLDTLPDTVICPACSEDSFGLREHILDFNPEPCHVWMACECQHTNTWITVRLARNEMQEFKRKPVEIPALSTSN